jgi:predicted carbohydrate-binding protein with CBM5 and CBM33 domain
MSYGKVCGATSCVVAAQDEDPSHEAAPGKRAIAAGTLDGSLAKADDGAMAGDDQEAKKQAAELIRGG